jgi:hypothetical protein
MTPKTGSAPRSQAATLDGGNSVRSAGPARQSPEARHREMVLRAVVPIAAARLLRDRQFQEKVITLVLAAAAVAVMARKDTFRSLTQLSAWTERNYLREAKHHHQHATS